MTKSERLKSPVRTTCKGPCSGERVRCRPCPSQMRSSRSCCANRVFNISPTELPRCEKCSGCWPPVGGPLPSLPALTEAQRTEAMKRLTILRPVLEEGISQAEATASSPFVKCICRLKRGVSSRFSAISARPLKSNQFCSSSYDRNFLNIL